MIRNLKALGLALVAVFAMSAMAASGASAQQGEFTPGEAVEIVGTEIIGQPNQLEAFEETVKCPGSSYDVFKWTEAEETPHTAPPDKGDTTATVTPTYENNTCQAGSGLKATVTKNTCDFVFHVGKTTGEGAGTYGVDADVECTEPNDEIVVHVYLSATNENINACTIRVPEQTDITSTAHLTNESTEGVGDITLSGVFHDITVSEEGLCGSNEEEDGTFTANVTLKGFDSLGSPTPISISHE